MNVEAQIPTDTRTRLHILRFEMMDGKFNKLMKRLGVHAGLAPGIKDKDFGKEKCPTLVRSAFNARTAKLIREVYAEDFKQFKYPLSNAGSEAREKWRGS